MKKARALPGTSCTFTYQPIAVMRLHDFWDIMGWTYRTWWRPHTASGRAPNTRGYRCAGMSCWCAHKPPPVCIYDNAYTLQGRGHQPRHRPKAYLHVVAMLAVDQGIKPNWILVPLMGEDACVWRWTCMHHAQAPGSMWVFASLQVFVSPLKLSKPGRMRKARWWVTDCVFEVRMALGLLRHIHAMKCPKP